MGLNKSQYILFEIVKVGLWGENSNDNNNSVFNKGVDWSEVYKLAQEQSVQGLVLQGLEELRTKNIELRVPQGLLLQWIGEVKMIEQRNKEMNNFVADLIEKLRKYNIYALLVKGQGIAQCYEKPLWRVCGDVDLLLSETNYEKAKEILAPLSDKTELENTCKKHMALQINGFQVELHGKLYCGLSWRIDRNLEEIKHEIFNKGNVRATEFESAKGLSVQVFVPGIECDVIYVFSHILQHFFKGGIGIRQICDWCRLLWTYRDSLNRELLESRIRDAGLITEWKVFAAFAVDWLGMPREAMPFYSSNTKWSRKTEHIIAFILETGNFGHNRDYAYKDYPFFIRKCFSMGHRIQDLCRHFVIFPQDSLKFFPYIMFNGIRSAIKGEG